MKLILGRLEGWGWRNGCARGGRGGDEINTTYGGPSPPHPTDCTMHKYETNTNTNTKQIQMSLRIQKEITKSEPRWIFQNASASFLVLKFAKLIVVFCGSFEKKV